MPDTGDHQQRKPMWSRLVLGAIVVVVASFAIAVTLSRSSAEAARWRLDISFVPQPSSTEIPILISEAACASGRPTTGRTKIDIDYSGSAVTIGIKVKPLGGDQSCQAVETPYVAQLREPLGARVLLGANAPTP